MAVRNDPFSAFSFMVEIDGVLNAGFSEVTGLGIEITPIEYREGADPTTVRKLPGLRKYSNIVLKRGFTADRSLWTWMQTVLNGQIARTNMSIILLDAAKNAVLQWNVVQAWPCKYEGPVLSAESNEVAIESVEICHEGIELA